MLHNAEALWTNPEKLSNTAGFHQKDKSLAGASPYIVIVDAYLESHFHSLSLPLNFGSPADFSESFQELRAQHEFKCFTGLSSSYLAEMSQCCFENILNGNSSLFCSCWDQVSPLKESSYCKLLSTVVEHSTAVQCTEWCPGDVPFQTSFSFSADSTSTAQNWEMSARPATDEWSQYKWYLGQRVSPKNFIQSNMLLTL